MNACSNTYKWTEIRNRISEAQWYMRATMFLNFTSGVHSVFGIPNIPPVSNDFRDVKKSKVHYGVW
jgi:hypothetical protein